MFELHFPRLQEGGTLMAFNCLDEHVNCHGLEVYGSSTGKWDKYTGVFNGRRGHDGLKGFFFLCSMTP